MPSGRHPRASSGIVAEILSAMSAKLSIQRILRETGVSTTVLYKVIKDYPLWSYYLRKDD